MRDVAVRYDGPATDPGLLRQIAQAIAGIRYGSVEIVIHDSRVVQVERREKVRVAGHDEQDGIA
ncbi:MAG TPA: YezD family protein [Gemmatimonadales bacterium]|nr:YezD family protein [Gemmatimonadales bacterium]